MLRSKTLPLCRRACFYRPQRLLTGRSQPSPESGIPSHEPTPNTEESTVRTTESQTEVNVDKQNAGTKGRKGGRKSKKQFTLAIPEQFFITNYTSYARNTSDISKMPYKIPECIIDDVRYSIRAGLSARVSTQAALPSDNVVIGVPYAGATYLQDAIVHGVARELGSDVITLDQHDLSFLSHDLIDTKPTKEDDIEPVLIEPESENALDTARKSSSNGDFEDDRSDDFVVVEDVVDYVRSVINQKDGSSGRYFKSATSYSKVQTDSQSKMKAIFGAIISIGEKETPILSNTPAAKVEKTPKIVYLRDYSHIIESPIGELVVTALLQTIQDLRNQNQEIVAVAGVSPSISTLASRKNLLNGQPINNKIVDASPDIQDMEDLLGNKIKFPYFQLVSIPPDMNSASDIEAWQEQMKRDLSRRVQEINARNILTVCIQKSILSPAQAFVSTPIVTKILAKIESSQTDYWPMHFVQRLVATAIGMSLAQKGRDINDKPLNMSYLVNAEKVLTTGSDLRSQVLRKVKSETESTRKKLASVTGEKELDMKALKEICTEHERKLLTKIVDPARIKTTFENICAPETTIETLQTSISLPLIRPDIFSYGILGRSFTSGMLLFGPPGTGKTMLAKAVAKESGSRMIEIQASDIYEMYVGEGEKNVKAVFSLARKIAPCVIFIDEVDSLLNARRSDFASNTHREIVNQFMVEWDGLSSDNHGVILMAATNRPYDLDDAVLRRMPRRILVDLPNEAERAKILSLHLQGEQMDAQVSLSKLAKETAYYSGSDIKNLCIAAALNAVKETTADIFNSIKSNESKGIEDAKSIRLLKQHHFDKARSQIAPSASEDMHSLIEIHKWDGLYGDGKHRRPHKGIGFNVAETVTNTANT